MYENMFSSFRVLQKLCDTAQTYPHKVAVVLDEQAWTYSELIEKIERVVIHLYSLNIVHGQIIYQFLERGFQMVCGLFGILCAGGVYCPLNPVDPIDRLVVLLAQMQSQYVLLHEKTRHRFPSATVNHVISLDVILDPFSYNEDIYDWPVCSEYGAAYILCTSGTTGQQKLVLHTHRSFSTSDCIFIPSHARMYTVRDQILQVSSCSWIPHMTEISMPLIMGGTLILLRPGGHLNIPYFCQTVFRQQVNTILIGPTLIRALTSYLEMSQQFEIFKFVRHVSVSGEAMQPQQWTRFVTFFSSPETRIYLIYGMSECFGVLGCYLTDTSYKSIPIGYPLPGIRCLLIDEDGQVINSADNSNTIGEIHIGGPTLLNCYLNNPERTAKAFVNIDNHVYLKTGDLARYNGRAELVHAGRVDFQIKIRGQRVETAEIENTVINFSPDKISSCLIIKTSQNDDLLIAYIVSNDLEMDTAPIRDYCQKHLRQYMVPSYFIVLDKFPVTATGKVNRKELPLPKLLSQTSVNSPQIGEEAMSELETRVHRLWCSEFHLDSIPRHANCFALGGSSLTLMHLFNAYQFHLVPDKELHALDFFIHPTIANHAQLLSNSISKTNTDWYPLHLVQGVASFAQQRLWMDEKVRFSNSTNEQIAVYNELLIYTVSSDTTLSIDQLRQALSMIVTKHRVLRTALIYDQEQLLQKVLPITNNLHEINITDIADDNHLKQILYDEETNRTLFNSEQGRVFRCHVLRHCNSNNNNSEHLKHNDIIVFNFHHIAIDGNSILIFINDLRQALATQQLPYNEENTFDYLDYALYERLDDWSDAQLYWSNVLNTFSHSLDQSNSSLQTGKGYTVTFDLDHDVVIALNRFISQSELTLFQVGLAAFFVFLFKMSNSRQTDLCTSIVVMNRPQYYLQSVIGFFSNTLPFLLKIDPHASFAQLCHQIQQIWLEILPYSHLPYQEIVKFNQQMTSSLLQTHFLIETTKDNDQPDILLNDGTRLTMNDRSLLTGHSSKFSMVCKLFEDYQNETITVSLNASLDLYDPSTVSDMASRLKQIFDQLFSVSSIYQFNILLPDEVRLMQDLNSNSVNKRETSCVHWDFTNQASQHPQKVALVLEHGSMTFGELLYYAQQLANHLITEYAVQPGEKIGQLTERSFEMLIGMLSIWMSGCVYMPLNTHDSAKRMSTCIRQSDVHRILIHHRTSNASVQQYSLLHVDQTIFFNEINQKLVDYIDSVDITPDHLSHTVFTNTSIETSKAVSLRHQDLISTVRLSVIQPADVVLHHTSVSFDGHLLETVGTLIKGGQVVLLHPNGSFDIGLFSKTIRQQQVTCLNVIPTLLNVLVDYRKHVDTDDCLGTLHCIMSNGEPLTMDDVHRSSLFAKKQCRFYNCYGHAECSGTVIRYMMSDDQNQCEVLPMGRPMSNVHTYLVDEYLQATIPGVQTGEIIIGTPFCDYSNSGFCNYNGEICYRTGDLAWLNTANEQLEFRGCRDDQLKLRSHSTDFEDVRVVLKEIVTNCIVIKSKHVDIDYLVAYVQTTHSIRKLREYCLAHLPSYLVPGVFMIVDELPLDRLNLPLPDVSSLMLVSNAEKRPRTEMEERVCQIWRQALPHIDSIPSIWTSFSSLGDDPESFIKLLHLYLIHFAHNLSITTFLKQSTVAEHARLLFENVERKNSLMITEAPASAAQIRLWLDEKTRLDSNKPFVTLCNMPFVYRLDSNHTLSITKLQYALQRVVRKHFALGTALYFDTDANLLMQRVNTLKDESKQLFRCVETTFETDEQLADIMYKEKNNAHLFNLTQGLVFRCHLLYYKQIPTNDLLCDKDAIVFNFHRTAFDVPSMTIFLQDLHQAYMTGQFITKNQTLLNYLDYAIIEHEIPMTAAKMFWLDTLNDYNLDRPLPLPYDRYRVSNEHRTGRSLSISFDFGQDLSYSFLQHALSNTIPLEHLALTCYYGFLFKLCNGERDLCVGMQTHNRCTPELMSVIGLFDNIIPLRCQLDPRWSLHQLVKYVQEMMKRNVQYSYYPLQRISTQRFDTIFAFTSSENQHVENEVLIGDSQLKSILIPIRIDDEDTSTFDFALTINYDSTASQLSCTIDASLDLFTRQTIDMIASRFYLMMSRLFDTEQIDIPKATYELSLTTPNERLLVQSINNTEVLFPSVSCVHHDFAHRTMRHPQKLAVELDQQSLTYSELLHCAQTLALELLSNNRINPHDIVCQCVERSLSMVIGIMGIIMTGGVYCPLSPRDPTHRLYALVQQTRTRVTLVHASTAVKFTDDFATLNIDSLVIGNTVHSEMDIDSLSTISVTPEDIAYVIFTSGSTGTPKAARVRHRNLTQCMHSFVHTHSFNECDTVLQMARCSFDIHLQDIMGTLVIGGTIIMLHPRGNIDFDYLARVLKEKQTSYVHTVPSLLYNFFTYLKDTNQWNVINSFRSLSSGGESFSIKLVELLLENGYRCQVWNVCGPAETTIDCTIHQVDLTLYEGNIPIGCPFPNYCCMVFDDFFQHVAINQEGELFVGGVGVFAGYLGRDDLTEKALVDIDGEIFYRTGDLVRMDSHGLLHYLGRKDHQIKLHGQRIELGEIERCLLNLSSISACVVTKWNEDHLVAYVQSSITNEEELRSHCQSHLPPHMVPSLFMILEKLPLNANGKTDRKQLPTPHFSSITQTDDSSSSQLTPLEEQLRDIFSEAFHIETPDVTISFGRMGGTSLDAMRAIYLIRQKISTKIDVSLLFVNPSIRQLARAIEPLLSTNVNDANVTHIDPLWKREEEQQMPSLCIELLGILLLLSLWCFPISLAYYFNSLLLLVFVPIWHLFSYVGCQRLLIDTRKEERQANRLYSWEYYRWLFLNNLWSVNNSFWLKHLLGTPFYNAYLRLCGAKIGNHSHIYTPFFDAPWMIEIGQSTFIGEDVIFSSLSYQDHTFELHPIRIGSCCSIETRSVIYENVIVEDNVYVQPMSAITGHLTTPNHQTSINNRTFSFIQTLHQFVCLFSLLFIHGLLIYFIYFVYQNCLIFFLPVPMSLAFVWLIWVLTSLIIVAFLLKFVVGSIIPGHYRLTSHYYLHKLWFRQLILTSFQHAIHSIPSYDSLTSIVLRWLGAHIDDDVKFAEFHQIIRFPSNLLYIERSATTFGGVKLAPFHMTNDALCYVDQIHLGSKTNLTNWCTVLPGTQLSSEQILGSLSLLTEHNDSSVLLGIPARQMPFTISEKVSLIDGNSLANAQSIPTWLLIYFSFFICKYFLIIIYSSLPLIIAPVIHIWIFCFFHQYSTSLTKDRSQFQFSEVITHLQYFQRVLFSDFYISIGSYLSGTQYLIFLFRFLGAQIGSDVIIADLSCLTDPHLVSIGNHIRLHHAAYIQCHTFERRVFKLAPVTVHDSCVLMSNTLVLSGSSLQGSNRILPLTLVMKNDQLPSNTTWSGVPARRIN